MSGIGVISQEYKSTANLFKTLNESIMLLKKYHYQLKSAEDITVEELSAAKESLADILGQVITQLDDDYFSEENEQYSSQIPPFFIKRLQEKHKGEIDWYKEDLKEVQEILANGQQLRDKFIKRLDELCEQLDAETTRLYRKLRRR